MYLKVCKIIVVVFKKLINRKLDKKNILQRFPVVAYSKCNCTRTQIQNRLGLHVRRVVYIKRQNISIEIGNPQVRKTKVFSSPNKIWQA